MKHMGSVLLLIYVKSAKKTYDNSINFDYQKTYINMPSKGWQTIFEIGKSYKRYKVDEP